MKPHFEWNPEKAKVNLQKHQVDFEEASTIFDDPQFITFLDEEHSADEERYITIGLSSKNRLLMAAHTGPNDHIRIISARKVTKHEEKFYQAALNFFAREGCHVDILLQPGLALLHPSSFILPPSSFHPHLAPHQLRQQTIPHTAGNAGGFVKREGHSQSSVTLRYDAVAHTVDTPTDQSPALIDSHPPADWRASPPGFG